MPRRVSEPQRWPAVSRRKRACERARSDEFKSDTVRWYLVNSEDVGDVGAMLTLAMTVGFGVTAVLLYIFTTENLKQYAVLKAMGATSTTVAGDDLRAGRCLRPHRHGTGPRSVRHRRPIVASQGFPFRMMWFTPLVGGLMVFVVCVLAALISARSVLKLEPAAVFAGRN